MIDIDIVNERLMNGGIKAPLVLIELWPSIVIELEAGLRLRKMLGQNFSDGLELVFLVQKAQLTYDKATGYVDPPTPEE